MSIVLQLSLFTLLLWKSIGVRAEEPGTVLVWVNGTSLITLSPQSNENAEVDSWEFLSIPGSGGKFNGKKDGSSTFTINIPGSEVSPTVSKRKGSLPKRHRLWLTCALSV